MKGMFNSIIGSMIFFSSSKRIWPLLLLAFVGHQLSAQSGCPSLVATGGPSIVSGSCATLSSTIQATLGTTSYTVGAIPYLPYSYTAGTTVLLGLDDQYTTVLPIPFNFCYYGNSYNKLVIGANGNLSFDVTQASLFDSYSQTAGTGAIPNTLYKTNIFCPFEDIDPAYGGTITWSVHGTAPCRQFVINFNKIPMFSCTTDTVTSQCVLNETTNYVDVYIKKKYICNAWNGGLAILGIQNATYTKATVVPGRNCTQWSASQEGWRFYPAGLPSYTYEWTQGTTLLGTATTLSVCPPTTTTYTATLVNTNCDGSKITLSSTTTVTVTDPVPIVPACTDIKVYSGVSPNSDGKNDTWIIDCIETFPDNDVTILNLWGQVVWQASGYDNQEKLWKGTNQQGEPLPDGTYFYMVDIRWKKHKGRVELIR
jgi:gliding motility-associated-like protein